MILLVAAGIFAAIAIGAAARSVRFPRACHYCSRMRPPRKLQRIELTDVGSVEICRETGSCRRAAAKGMAR
jgi:hypothetical protein